ncbi:MAG: hypothetical protein H7145_22395, partial [Akkermansiaceae bacterium]|nr:hypothetical protein [Armatimonadota bacterium]
MESYLYINIHTGKWLKIDRGAEPIPEWMKRFVSNLPPPPNRIEIAGCWMREEGSLHVRFFTDTHGFFENGWTLISEKYGDRFLAVCAQFGCGEADGRSTRNYSVSPLDGRRELEAGETLIAHPPVGY